MASRYTQFHMRTHTCGHLQVMYMSDHPDEATFDDLAAYPEIFKAFLKLELRRGTTGGKPRPRAGEEFLEFRDIYTADHKVKRINMVSPRTTTAHPYLKFCRGVSHNRAINGCRNAGAVPCRVLAKNTPTGQEFDNFSKCLYTYWVNYCSAEGLSRSSKMARRMLMYLFYAKVLFKGKLSPCIRVIHSCMIAGTHRFSTAADVAFEDLLNLIKKNPDLKKFSTDKGVGTPSRKYMTAVVSA